MLRKAWDRGKAAVGFVSAVVTAPVVGAVKSVGVGCLAVVAAFALFVLGAPPDAMAQWSPPDVGDALYPVELTSIADSLLSGYSGALIAMLPVLIGIGVILWGLRLVMGRRKS